MLDYLDQQTDVTTPNIYPTQIMKADEETVDEASDEEYHSLDTDSNSSWYSDTESEEEDETENPETRQAEREARAKERQRVLEAAGLVIKPSDAPPPVRARSMRNKRRPPPPADSPA